MIGACTSTYNYLCSYASSSRAGEQGRRQEDLRIEQWGLDMFFCKVAAKQLKIGILPL